MQYFPVFIDAEHLSVLIVGAGEVGARKLELILKTPAKVTIVSPWVSDTVKLLVAEHSLALHERKFEDADIFSHNMIFVATDDPHVNQHIHDHACAHNILVNVVDNTPLCKFITPSIVDRSPIIIAMSSGGVAPVLLRYLRQKLESVIPNKVERLGRFSEKFRNAVKSRLATVTQRRYFWESVLDGDIAETVLQGNEVKADADFIQELDNFANDDHSQGEDYLVGAGPGDPELLT
ncbi:MAG TPA: siroheme synthase, partial [Glaciecola sp.]|nr:siroheme synthase [Glaciecola sp.]